MTSILKIDPSKPGSRIQEAASVIKKGGLVAFPTETVYGLGASIYNSKAVLKVFKVKKRPLTQPLPILVSSMDELIEVSSQVPEEAFKVAEKAWPGPLTIIVRKSGEIPKEVTGGGDTIGVRIPAHPIALGLIKESNSPLTGPSANIHGKPSPLTADHVKEDLYGKIDMIIDGGEAFLGLESTVIDFTVHPPLLVRPGMLEVEKLRVMLGGEITVPRCPTPKVNKYVLKTPILLVEGEDVQCVAERVKEASIAKLRRGLKVAVLATSESRGRYEDLNALILDMGSRENPYEIAKRVFGFLRDVDRLGVDLVIVEGIDERGIGLAVMDRLRRAATQLLKAI